MSLPICCWTSKFQRTLYGLVMFGGEEADAVAEIRVDAVGRSHRRLNAAAGIGIAERGVRRHEAIVGGHQRGGLAEAGGGSGEVGADAVVEDAEAAAEHGLMWQEIGRPTDSHARAREEGGQRIAGAIGRRSERQPARARRRRSAGSCGIGTLGVRRRRGLRDGVRRLRVEAVDDVVVPLGDRRLMLDAEAYVDGEVRA